MQNIYKAFIQYLETNRLANLSIRTSWRQRLQNHYLAHYLQQKPPLTGPCKTRQINVEKK